MSAPTTAPAPTTLGNSQTVLQKESRGDRSGQPVAARLLTWRERERILVAREARAHRYWRRDSLRLITTLDRARACGRKVCSEAGVTLGVRENTDGTMGAAFGGLSTCASVWCCPQCAAKIATHRAAELGDVMRAVHDAGGSAFVVTATVRHSAGDRLGLSSEDRSRWAKLDKRRKDADVIRASAEVWPDEHPDEDPADCPWVLDERQAEADEIERLQIEARRGTWDHLSYGWGAATSGGDWDRAKHQCGGLIGWVRVVETTDGGDISARAEGYSGNGWHVHIHALVAVAANVSVELFTEQMARGMFERFRRAVGRRGVEVSEEHGWDVRKAQLGEGALHDYFMKLAHETTGSHRKEGKRQGGRTPMQLLADAVETYRVDLIERWRAWEQASKGRRQLEWSRGRYSLRRFAGLGREATDEEIAEEEQDADVRLGLPHETWAWITYTGQTTTLLDVTEEHGLAGACRWLDGRGLDWFEAEPTRKPPRPVHQPYGWQHDARQPVRARAS